MIRSGHALALVMLPLAVACGRTETSPAPRVSGHIEATEVTIAPDVGGRILELRLNEGDRVAAGDVVARLDTRDTELQLRRANADRASAVAQLRLLQAGARPEDVRQADAQVQAAEADVSAIDADLQSAELDLQRYESLLQANAGSRKQRDDAQARVDVARQRQRGARDRVTAARETAARLRSGSRPEEIEGARARVGAADAQIATLQKAIADARVIAPVGGIVTQRLAETGELVAPHSPMLIVTDLDHAWANLFVPEPMVPNIKIGQPANVFTDAGGAGIPGTVTFVSPRAEFTPRNVQTAEERSKLVYRIKVSVDNRAGTLKPGMPVDAELHP
jgi:HlyD family secretion protein